MSFKNWKVYTTVFASLVALAIPQNGFTCADVEDPYDYFTSFFSRYTNKDEQAYKPFYYTSLLTFYDDMEESSDSVNYDHDPIIADWKQYSKNAATADIVNLLYKSSAADLKAVAENATTHKPLPATLQHNAMVQWLLKENNQIAINYLVFAKRTEQFSTQSSWEEPKKRDSLGLNKYIQQSTELAAKTTDPFIKDRYAFQQCKLAFYNHRYTDCIKWCDAYFKPDVTTALNHTALSYKAGSLYRLGKKKEAAYYFSKAFSMTDWNKKQVYEGFLWSTDNCNPDLENDYLSLCKTDKERATMLGMFTFYGTTYRPEALERIYSLDPLSPFLTVLATREINKIEEQYLTPQLNLEHKVLYATYVEESKDLAKEKPQVLRTITFLEKIASDRNNTNSAFYKTGAAYLYFITKNYTKAKSLLKEVKKGTVNDKLNDQIQMINLLITANENKIIDKETENQLLTSMQWITNKAKNDQEYAVFYRNFFEHIMSTRYLQQGDQYKAALALGVSDEKFLFDDIPAEYGKGLRFVRNEMSTEQLLKLNELSGNKNRSGFEDYLITHSSFKQDHVIDVIATSYLRDHKYNSAIEWLKKMNRPTQLTATNYNYQTGKENTINPDPFFDYLNDWQRYTKTVAKPYTKLSLAEKLVELQGKIDTSKNAESKSKLYYQYGNALYNMSFYGNVWSALAYDRSGVDWNRGDYKLNWQKEYYGVYEARNMYQKAYELTANKEFKGACMFMVIKCAQRQIPEPDYDYDHPQEADRQDSIFKSKFKNSALFPAFQKEFGDTKFFKYVYNRCSYLRDFVVRKK